MKYFLYCNGPDSGMSIWQTAPGRLVENVPRSQAGSRLHVATKPRRSMLADISQVEETLCRSIVSLPTLRWGSLTPAPSARLPAPGSRLAQPRTPALPLSRRKHPQPARQWRIYNRKPTWITGDAPLKMPRSVKPVKPKKKQKTTTNKPQQEPLWPS